jgi:hypothetical protein
MIRFTIALTFLALTACAAGAPQPAVQSPMAAESTQVYQSLQLHEVEQQMLNDDDEITYGNAVVACGLRDQHWLDVLQGVYASDYAVELQRIPLNPDQLAAAKTFAQDRIQNPTPPPLICQMLSTDSALGELDNSVAVESFTMASAK